MSQPQERSQSRSSSRYTRRSTAGSRHPGGCAPPPQSVPPVCGTSSNTPLLEATREIRQRRRLPPSARAANEDPRRRGRSAPCARPQACRLRPAARRLAAIAPGSWLLKGGFALDLRLAERARATKDVDLDWQAAEAELLDTLLKAAEWDAADFFSFKIERTGAATGPPWWKPLPGRRNPRRTAV